MGAPKRIITEAEKLFKARSIRSVTMDDIAAELGMSKKTLYQHFKNKAEIVHQVTQAHMYEELCIFQDLHNAAHDPLEEMVLILKSFTQVMKDIPAAMIYEIQKYYPESWALFNEFKNTHMVKAVEQNLIQGQQQGIYRMEMDVKLTSKIRVEQVSMVFNPQIFSPTEYDYGKVQVEMFSLFLHGLVTEKGRQLLYQYLNQA